MRLSSFELVLTAVDCKTQQCMDSTRKAHLANPLRLYLRNVIRMMVRTVSKTSAMHSATEIIHYIAGMVSWGAKNRRAVRRQSGGLTVSFSYSNHVEDWKLSRRVSSVAIFSHGREVLYPFTEAAMHNPIEHEYVLQRSMREQLQSPISARSTKMTCNDVNWAWRRQNMNDTHHQRHRDFPSLINCSNP